MNLYNTKHYYEVVTNKYYTIRKKIVIYLVLTAKKACFIIRDINPYIAVLNESIWRG